MPDPADRPVNLDDFDDWAVHHGSFYPPESRHDLEFRLSRKLVLTGRRWVTFIDGLVKARHGHSRARWQTMFSIAFAEPPVTTIALARRLGVQWPTLIRVLDDLEREGLIVRRDNPEDRRSRWIELSDEGARLIREIQTVIDPARAQVLAGLSDAEIRLCSDLLDRIYSHIGTWRDEVGRADADGAGTASTGSM